MKRSQQFRIAIRKFAPFESAIQKQWDAFEAVQQTGLQLDPVALDLHPLSNTLIEKEGLLRDDWDVAFISTDWLAAVAASGSAIDLTPWIRQKSSRRVSGSLDRITLTYARDRRKDSRPAIP
jgi:multiple sugar transport system substrate-binding protein